MSGSDALRTGTMTKVVRHVQGKTRPHDAPWHTIYLRRTALWLGEGASKRWRTFRTNREARRSIVPNRSWRRWRPSVGRLVWAYALIGTLMLGFWVGLAVYDSLNSRNAWVHKFLSSTWFQTVGRFLGPVLVAAFVLALFLLYW